MNTLQSLIQNKDHKAISLLPSPTYDVYKGVACIHMEKYNEALNFVNKNSYEYAYCLYKLKNYKKSIRILKKLENTPKVMILLSQCLYYLGYYNGAYEILSGLSSDDEIVVNISAIKSMAIYSSRGSINERLGLSSKDIFNSKFIDFSRYKFTDTECHKEYLFNQTFEYMNDKEEYLKELQSVSENNLLVKNQIKNVNGEFSELDSVKLTRLQREVLELNMKKTKFISKPTHFLCNAFEIEDLNEFKSLELNANSFYCYLYLASKNLYSFDLLPIFENKREKLKLLYNYIHYKGGNSKSTDSVNSTGKKLSEKDVKTALKLLKINEKFDKKPNKLFERRLKLFIKKLIVK
ncbi:hypothetical protein CWI38_0244p0040 [Hamiltosporidium tvaerminnensis]|uniref:Uncharacterized protein n=2 Tax=Hamiltosporidium tvaerminnensis TaxID=1176355 RepID=A0A4Q9M228_9MICR|nr:hypothetical protein CWI38_0244p0040 [Hamiltosporidium tvaerminnensis]